jgi:dTMP kinase
MRDRPSVSIWSDIVAALRGELGGGQGVVHSGIFIAFEGGEGSGKSTQVKLLTKYLESIGEVVVLTREPGETSLGKKLREILLSPETGNISPRSETLLYAADRANHVAAVVKPALVKGEVVITDRYMDSSIAYQGAGRVLQPAEIARISRWATETLYPDLTIVLDIPAEIGLSRFTERDRLEAEPLAFHERVRQEFLHLAKSDPERYLIVDARLSIDEISTLIIDRVKLLPRLKINKKQS